MASPNYGDGIVTSLEVEGTVHISSHFNKVSTTIRNIFKRKDQHVTGDCIILATRVLG